MRVLLDTNVLISALITQGRSAELLDYCVVNHTIVTSEYILEELCEKLVEKFDYTDDEGAEAALAIRKQSELVKHGMLPVRVSRDADDDNILAAALAAKSDIIVSGDKDLLVLRTFEGIPIVSPKVFWDMISYERPPES